MPRLEQEFISVVFKSHFCSGSRRGISAKETFPTSVTVNTTLWWRRRRSITTQALTYLRCVTIFSCLVFNIHISGREPSGDVGSQQPSDDDGGWFVQPAQGEPWRLPRHLLPRVQRRLRLALANVSPPSRWAHQQVAMFTCCRSSSILFSIIS